MDICDINLKFNLSLISINIFSFSQVLPRLCDNSKVQILSNLYLKGCSALV